MRRRQLGMAALIVAAGVLGLAAVRVEAVTAYQGKNRPLLVFAGSGSDPALARQRGIVKALRPAFIDRKMVVVYVSGDTVTADLGPPPQQSASALRQRYGVGDGQFRAVLIGLDGGVKLTASEPIAGEKLFATIDAMPTRQDEQRKGR